MPTPKSSRKKRPPKVNRAARGDGSVYQIADGRYVATTYLGPGTTPHRSYGHSQTEAIDKRAKWETALARGEVVSPTTSTLRPEFRTVGDWGTWWLEHLVKPRYDAQGRRASGRQPTTYQCYASQIRSNIRPYPIWKIVLRDVKLTDIEMWGEQLVAAGKGAVTRDKARIVLSTLLARAVDRQEETGLVANPAKRYKPAPPVARKRPPPDQEALVRLIDQVRGEYLELVVHIGLHLGLRRSEIAALKWGDFELEGPRPMLHLQRRLNRLIGRGVVATGSIKMRHEDSPPIAMPLPADLLEPLERHRKRVIALRLKSGLRWQAGDPVGPDGWLFPKPDGEPTDPRNLNTWLRNQAAAAGLPASYTLHNLRHDAAGIMLRQQRSVWEVAQVLNHRGIDTLVGIYAHMMTEHQREVASEVGTWLRAARDASAAAQ